MLKHSVKTPPNFRRGSSARKRFKEADYDDHAHVMAGDHYGTGKKAKVGRMRGDSVGMIPVPPKKLHIPPKAVG